MFFVIIHLVDWCMTIGNEMCHFYYMRVKVPIDVCVCVPNEMRWEKEKKSWSKVSNFSSR